LTNNDPELLSHSIRQLAQLAQEKEDGKAGTSEKGKEAESRRRELENVGTPYISIPGGRPPMRTPLGARGWDTPMMRNGEGSTRRRPAEAEDIDDLESEAPSRPGKKKKVQEVRRVRDDLTLDAFQRNYTSEDNASFVQIVDGSGPGKRKKELR
jgi:protein DGCR14